MPIKRLGIAHEGEIIRDEALHAYTDLFSRPLSIPPISVVRLGRINDAIAGRCPGGGRGMMAWSVVVSWVLLDGITTPYVVRVER